MKDTDAEWKECFWYTTETFEECETRTAFTSSKQKDWVNKWGYLDYQHYFKDKENADAVVDCWRFAYENYANCKTRSNYVVSASTKAPLIAAMDYLFFKDKESNEYVECFDY